MSVNTYKKQTFAEINTLKLQSLITTTGEITMTWGTSRAMGIMKPECKKRQQTTTPSVIFNNRWRCRLITWLRWWRWALRRDSIRDLRRS